MAVWTVAVKEIVINHSCLAADTPRKTLHNSLYMFFEENFFKKLSENLLTIKRF